MGITQKENVMKVYQIAMILSVPAESYEEACEAALELDDVDIASGSDITTKVELDYEHDNDGQRVLYLHPEEEPIEG